MRSTQCNHCMLFGLQKRSARACMAGSTYKAKGEHCHLENAIYSCFFYEVSIKHMPNHRD
jgi:hypothetical protein